MTSNSLLSGIRVLDLSRLLPGPFCSLYLAQLGAEVIKIEEPDGGDYARGTPEMFALVNRGKKSVTLDLRKAEDRAHFMRLVETADVVLESFRPGVMKKLGCDYAALKAVNPRLVYASLTGYGQDGPYRDRAGHDMNYLAIAGALEQIGRAGAPPALSNIQIADLAGGALTCALGIVAALFGARQSGQGTFVDVAMMDGSFALQPIALAALRETGRSPKRGADLLTGAMPNYTIYRCRDGKYLSIGALEPKFFLALLKALAALAPRPLNRALGRAFGGSARKDKGDGMGAAKVAKAAGGKDQFTRLRQLAGEPARARRMLAPVRWTLQAIFLTRTRDQWAAALATADACVEPILTIEEALAHEQVRARGLIEMVDGKPAFAMPIQFSEPRRVLGSAPQLGEHTAEVLAAGAVEKMAPPRSGSAGMR